MSPPYYIHLDLTKTSTLTMATPPNTTRNCTGNMEAASSNIFFALTDADFCNYKLLKTIHLSNTRIMGYYDRQWNDIKPAKRIRYFIKPTKKIYPIDLNVGYKEYIMTKNYSKNLDLCLSYELNSVEHKVENKTKVYIRYGTLVQIMKSLYYGKYMNIRVSRYNGNLYITNGAVEKDNDDDGTVRNFKADDTHHNQIKRYFFADTPKGKPNLKEPWNENIELLAVFQSNFGKYDIIYNGAVHAIMSDDEFKDFSNMSELNKCRFIMIKEMWKNVKNKEKNFLHYFYHAYITGVNDIFVAYKDNNGIVKEPLEHKIVREFPKHFYDKLWTSEAYLYDLLERIEKLMANVNCLDTVYVIRKIQDNLYYGIYEGKTNRSFIAQFYKDYFQNKN